MSVSLPSRPDHQNHTGLVMLANSVERTHVIHSKSSACMCLHSPSLPAPGTCARMHHSQHPGGTCQECNSWQSHHTPLYLHSCRSDTLLWPPHLIVSKQQMRWLPITGDAPPVLAAPMPLSLPRPQVDQHIRAPLPTSSGVVSCLWGVLGHISDQGCCLLMLGQGCSGHWEQLVAQVQCKDLYSAL
jgi:hypothetical protein